MRRAPNCIAWTLLASLWCGIACAETLSLPELLQKMEKGFRAPGASFRLQWDDYQTIAPDASGSEPIRISSSVLITDGARVRLEEQGMPASLEPTAQFRNENTTVWDGEIEKTLFSTESKPVRGTISGGRSKTEHCASAVMMGQGTISVQNISLFEQNVEFDATTNLYKLQTVSESGAHVVYWIDGARGYEVVKKEVFVNGKQKTYTEIELSETGGVWIPKVVRLYSSMDGEKLILARETKLLSLELNPQIAPDSFELVFPEGIEVVDFRNTDATKVTMGTIRAERLKQVSKKTLKGLDQLPEEEPAPSAAQETGPLRSASATLSTGQETSTATNPTNPASAPLIPASALAPRWLWAASAIVLLIAIGAVILWLGKRKTLRKP